MKRSFPINLTIAACALFLLGAGLGLWGCGAARTAGTTTLSETEADSTAPTRIEVTTTTLGEPIAVSMSGYGADLIPHPVVDGGFSYHGRGQFQILAADGGGPFFFWRDGHFVWADGSLMEIPERLTQLMAEKGIPFPEQQATVADLPDGLGARDFSDIPTEQALARVVRELSALGWWVRHTYIDSRTPLTVTFQLDEADNGPFVEDILVRAVLLAPGCGSRHPQNRTTTPFEA